MPKFLMLGIALFLLLAAAGYGLTTLQARSIPWDCADWQAFAHDDRTTSILESLAENRGKTLYCGVDQSDTFTKAETWQAGKDRNERDDTVYFGERGQFRGFIAAQEGYLTDGESGVTGVSIDRIFEFPREERRTKRVKRFDVGTDAEQFPINQEASCDEVLGLICSPYGGETGWIADSNTGERRGRALRVGESVWNTYWIVDWKTNIRHTVNAQGEREAVRGTSPLNADWWQGQAEIAATAACRARGARYAAGSADFGPGHDGNQPGVSDRAHYTGPGLGWFNAKRRNDANTADKFKARQSRTWTATCKKTIRRTRK